MFDSTIIGAADTGFDGQLPSAFSFPYFNFLSHSEPVSTAEFDGTVDTTKIVNDAYSKLFDEIYQAFTFARHTFSDIDETQLELAFREAKVLAASALFGDELSPNVSVDPYGEFTFSHRSAAGYVDIGVRGEGELSYHVRNDIDPAETKFDDYDWDEYNVPTHLFAALKSLRKHL